MKSKKLSFIFAVFLFPCLVSGQQLNFAMTSDTLVVMQPSDTAFSVTEHLTSSLDNTGTHLFLLDVIRLENDLDNPNAYWETGLCINWDLCAMPNVDSIRVGIHPDSLKTFRMFFRFFGPPVESMAHTKVLFRNVSDPGEYFIQDYYAVVNAGISAINESKTERFQLYPNPVSDQVTISGEKLSQDTDFVLFDLQGKEILRKNGLTQFTRIDLSPLNTGLYVYQIKEQNSVLASGKLNKN